MAKVKKEESSEVKAVESIEKKEELKTESIEKKQEPEVLEVTVNPETAFNLKLQEYDKTIAIAKFEVAKLEAQKMSFIYDSNLQAITDEHKQMLIKKQIEEEFKAKSNK